MCCYGTTLTVKRVVTVLLAPLGDFTDLGVTVVPPRDPSDGNGRGPEKEKIRTY